MTEGFEPVLMKASRSEDVETLTTNYQAKLFTPGPMLTSDTVRRAMSVDIDSRSPEMLGIIRFIRDKLVEIAGVSGEYYTCVPFQGSGTYTLEAIFNCTKRANSRVLILDNGKYGDQMMYVCQYLGIDVHMIGVPEEQAITADMVREFLDRDSNWTAIGIAHYETSTGILNHLEEVGVAVKEKCPDCILIADCMSAFGGVPLDLERSGIDFLVCSPNKCLEAVPGFAFTICKRERVLECKGKSSSFCLDIYKQYEVLEKDGIFRLTPPTHCLLALKQALLELEAEGGIAKRAERMYQCLHKIILEGMEELGFKHLVQGDDYGYTTTTYLHPQHESWNFEKFRKGLSDLGQIICPVAPLHKIVTFRIGNMGSLCPEDMHHLLKCIKTVLSDMGMPIPVS